VSLADIRAGLAANLATISGLRVSAEIPDNPSPPIAIIMLQSVAYDLAMHRGATTYNMQVTVLVGRVAEREAQRRLDAYISTGASSIKTAIESDRTLGGAAFDCRVTEMTDISNVVLEQTYLSATFSVQVLAS
jgi:hypothetical protein